MKSKETLDYMKYFVNKSRTLSENIELFLLLNRMKRNQFYYLSDLSQSTIYALSKHKPSQVTYEKLAKTMNVAIEDLQVLDITL